VLHQIYAKCISGREDASRSRIADALGSQTWARIGRSQPENADLGRAQPDSAGDDAWALWLVRSLMWQVS
jgi:hypothetical protein